MEGPAQDDGGAKVNGTVIKYSKTFLLELGKEERLKTPPDGVNLDFLNLKYGHDASRGSKLKGEDQEILASSEDPALEPVEDVLDGELKPAWTKTDGVGLARRNLEFLRPGGAGPVIRSRLVDDGLMPEGGRGRAPRGGPSREWDGGREGRVEEAEGRHLEPSSSWRSEEGGKVMEKAMRVPGERPPGARVPRNRWDDKGDNWRFNRDNGSPPPPGERWRGDREDREALRREDREVVRREDREPGWGRRWPDRWEAEGSKEREGAGGGGGGGGGREEPPRRGRYQGPAWMYEEETEEGGEGSLAKYGVSMLDQARQFEEERLKHNQKWKVDPARFEEPADDMAWLRDEDDGQAEPAQPTPRGQEAAPHGRAPLNKFGIKLEGDSPSREEKYDGQGANAAAAAGPPGSFDFSQFAKKFNAAHAGEAAAAAGGSNKGEGGSPGTDNSKAPPKMLTLAELEDKQLAAAAAVPATQPAAAPPQQDSGKKLLHLLTKAKVMQQPTASNPSYPPGIVPPPGLGAPRPAAPVHNVPPGLAHILKAPQRVATQSGPPGIAEPPAGLHQPPAVAVPQTDTQPAAAENRMPANTSAPPAAQPCEADSHLPVNVAKFLGLDSDGKTDPPCLPPLSLPTDQAPKPLDSFMPPPSGSMAALQSIWGPGTGDVWGTGTGGVYTPRCTPALQVPPAQPATNGVVPSLGLVPPTLGAHSAAEAPQGIQKPQGNNSQVPNLLARLQGLNLQQAQQTQVPTSVPPGFPPASTVGGGQVKPDNSALLSLLQRAQGGGVQAMKPPGLGPTMGPNVPTPGSVSAAMLQALKRPGGGMEIPPTTLQQQQQAAQQAAQFQQNARVNFPTATQQPNLQQQLRTQQQLRGLANQQSYMGFSNVPNMSIGGGLNLAQQNLQQQYQRAAAQQQMAAAASQPFLQQQQLQQQQLQQQQLQQQQLQQQQLQAQLLQQQRQQVMAAQQGQWAANQLGGGMPGMLQGGPSAPGGVPVQPSVAANQALFQQHLTGMFR